MKALFCILSLLLLFSCFQPVLSQGKLQSWDTYQHERSQKLLSLALTQLEKGLDEKAASLLIESINTDPTDAVPLSMLGLVYVRQGKYAEALDLLKKSYHMKNLAETLLTTGFAYYLQHDYDAAIASWTKALQRDPRMVEANGDIAFAYLRKGDFKNADEYFRILLKGRSNSPLAYQGLSILNYLAGNFSAARTAAERAQSIEPYYPNLLLLAKLDYLQGDPQTGQKRVALWLRASSQKKATKDQKRKTLYRSMTVLGYPKQHDFSWDPFLADNFDNGRLLLARTQEKKGSKKRQSLALKGKIKDLLSSARQAQYSAPSNYYLLRELGLLELANGDFSEAADHFREVLEKCPSCVVDWLHLARALSMQDKVSEASYGVREFQRLRGKEKIAPQFIELAKGAPAVIPELAPRPDSKLKTRDKTESGF